MATVKSLQRAKFTNVKRNDIERLINEGVLDENDIVYTKDTHENIFIGADLSINPVRSKIYRFLDVASAESKLNSASDTYEGQIVAILSDGAYAGYIVNKNAGGSYFVTKLSEDAKTFNYDTLGNRPIDNLDGTLDNPIIISNLSTGIYKIRGQYKICENDITTYISANDHIFLIGNDGSDVQVKKITSAEITQFAISENSIMSKSEIPTRQWIKDQGYITKSYVDDKLVALDYMTREEVEEYVKNIIENDIEPLIDKKIDKKLDESFSSVDSSDITYLF